MDAPELAGYERRPDRLGSMFSAISWRYDLLNTLMSLGQDGAWRRALAAPVRRGERVLDLCCGSARSSVPAWARSGRRVTGLDVSRPMLERGRAFAAGRGAGFDPVHGDGFALPFRDGTFDVVVAAFGLRNLVPLPAAAREIRRVLAPGGRFLALDSVAPAGGGFAPVHAFYLRRIVPLLGRLSPDPDAYRYLSASIFDFGPPAAVARRLADAGFTAVRYTPRLLGAVAIFEAQRGNPQSPRGAAAPGAVQSDAIGTSSPRSAMAGAARAGDRQGGRP
jgi:demethylmenaquinone methyltransferase/2-methoxy-6-polyprenyl-1,4-benzoquinol methylase